MIRTHLSRASVIAIAVSAFGCLPTNAYGADPASIEEVVVTSQRREEKLQQVPIAVTAVSGNALAENDIRDVSRLEDLVPGFTFGRSGSDARPAVRGVRTENVAVSGDPPIGYYVDGIYQTRASQALQPFVDVARVEVERGPQGTLFGRNTYGGAISVVTQAPTNQFEGGASFTFGDYSRYAGDAYVNLPLSNRVQIRVAGLRETMDGYVSSTASGQNIYNRDTAYGRIEGHVQITDDFDMLFRYSHWTENGTGAGAFGYRVGGVFINPSTGKLDLVSGIPVAVDPKAKSGAATDIFVAGVDEGFPIVGGPLTYNGDVRLIQTLRQDAASAQFNYDFGPVVLHSITGYTNFRVFRNGDNDFSPRVLNVDSQDDALTTWTEEVQLASAKGSLIDWILGYYYLNENINRSIFASFPETNQNGTASNAWPKTTSNAGYAQASYFVLPDVVRVTAGVRYTKDEKDVTRYISTFVSGAQSTVATNQGVNLSFARTTWRGDIDYFWRPENMLYFNVSTGFLSGGFNSGSLTNPAIPASFAPETVNAYEWGSKNRFFADRLQVNASLFRNDFNNLQVQNQFLIPAAGGGFTTSSAILNAATAHSEGIEAEIVSLPIDALRLTVTGTLTEAKYDSYANVPAPSLYSGTFNLTGKRIPYTPKYKMTANISYDISLGDLGKLRPQANVLWSGDYYNTDFNTVLDHQPGFVKADLRLSWSPTSEQYHVEGFINNVGNTVTLNRATFGSGGLNQSYDAPRMWGVRLAADF